MKFVTRMMSPFSYSQATGQPAGTSPVGTDFYNHTEFEFFFINSSIGSAFCILLFLFIIIIINIILLLLLGRILFRIFLSSVFIVYIFVKIFIHILEPSASTHSFLSICNT